MNILRRIQTKGLGLGPAAAAGLAIAVTLGCARQSIRNPVDIRRLPSEAPMFRGSQGAHPMPPPPEPDRSRFELHVTERTLTCDLLNAPLEDVLRQIDAATSLQFVYRGLLRGRVSAKLESSPLDDALRMLFAAADYSYERNGDVYVINRQGAGESNSGVQEVYLKNTDARQVLEQLSRSFEEHEPAVRFGLLPGAAGLYVVAPPEEMDDVLDVIAIIDRPVRQVLIETLVVDVEEEDFLNLGLGLTKLAGGKVSDIAFAPGSSVFPALSLSLDAAGDVSKSFFSTITALHEQGSAQIVSRPYVVTRSGEQAEMRAEQIVNVTAERTVSGNSISTFEEIRAGTILQINPTINPDDSITLSLDFSHSQFLSLSTVGDVDVRRTLEQAKAKINVRNGETIVLGGFIQRRDLDSIETVPFLGRVPFIKHLFTRQQTQIEDNETLFVLTPHILPIDFADFRNRQPPYLGEGSETER